MKGTIVSIKELWPDYDENPYAVEFVIRVCPEYDWYEGVSLKDMDDAKAKKIEDIEKFHLGDVELTQ